MVLVKNTAVLKGIKFYCINITGDVGGKPVKSMPH